MDRPVSRNRYRPRTVVAVILICLATGASVYGLLGKPSGSRLSVDEEKLTISVVERGPFQEFIPVRGTILPYRTVYLEASEGGRVEEIYVEEGAMVAAGDYLMRMENADLRVEVMREEARLEDELDKLGTTRLDAQQKLLAHKHDLTEYDFEIRNLRRLYVRSEALATEGMISAQDFESVQAQFDHAKERKAMAIQYQQQDSLLLNMRTKQQEAVVERVSRNSDLVSRRLDDLILRSPLDGQLTFLNGEIGQTLGRSERVGQIDVLDRFKIRAEVDEHYVARITRGQRGRVELGDREYQLLIKKVYPQVRDGRFQIDLVFDGPRPADLRRGQTVHSRLELGDVVVALLLARGAFYHTTGGRWAYVVEEGVDQAVKRPIRIGRQNIGVFEVLDGLHPGDRVVTSAYVNFGNNTDILLFQ